MEVRDENEYEDLLGQWSDLESGLGIILSSPASTQQFSHRVLQYDRWMQGLMQRDPDVGLYLLFQLASNSPVGYSASHASGVRRAVPPGRGRAALRPKSATTWCTPR